jgi:hypothetical protein
MIFGILRVAGLRLMSGIFGAWIDPLVRLTLAAIVAVGVGLAVLACWPSGHGAVERAAVEALADREANTAARDAEEIRDNAAIAAQTEQMRVARNAADKLAAGIAVMWRADDPWMRRHRASNR